ncbi:MAG: serine/threonine protein kinase [Myxococcales bacterium]|nr:serine/threonine protein kinase [Myxococcales bacterium]
MSGLADRTLPGALAEAFAIGEVIGRGATSLVYAATSQRGQVGALKVIFRQAPGPVASGQGQRMADCSRLVEIYQRGAVAGAAHVEFVFMERLQGDSLRERLQDGPLPWRAALQTARDLAEGLEVLHRAGLLHGDVKPDNAIVTARGTVLVDLDHLGRIDDEQAATGAGTPAYMAPEQATSSRLSAAVDVYALGCVLFEMLTGAPPFRGNGLALAVEHASTPLPLRRLGRGVPIEIASLLESLCAKQARKRPSAHEAVARLERLLRPSARRARAAWATVLLGALIAAGLGASELLVPTTIAAPQSAPVNAWVYMLAAHASPPRQVMVGGDDLQLTLSAVGGVITLDISDEDGLPVPLREIVVAVASADETPIIFSAQVVRPGRWQVRVPAAMASVNVAVYLPDRDASLRALL